MILGYVRLGIIRSHVEDDLPIAIQPVTWLPRGNPALSWRDVMLERVTMIERSIRPI